MRRGELTALFWEDIEEGCVYVQRSVDTGRGVRWGPPKNGEHRAVKIGPEMAATLERHRCFQNDSRLVFPNRLGGVLRGKTLKRKLDAALEKAGLAPMRFHDLRHTAATLMLKNGDPVHVVAKRLGHKDVAKTLRTYSHVLEDMQDESAARIDALFA